MILIKLFLLTLNYIKYQIYNSNLFYKMIILHKRILIYSIFYKILIFILSVSSDYLIKDYD